ncbi:TonB-dependent receptor [Salinibacter altiplanensis]|uniref:TonB-dependent receptor n=1 Tax=Salinibacter altiplanensis TaxID=1803181 RepID=UPI001E4459CC|nr:TonB-dependent receptor [Salinibacter altiplanensis]
MHRYIAFACFSCAFLLLVPAASAQSTGAVEGRVFDGETDTTLPEVNVVISTLDRGAVTDEEGRFALRNVPSGTYQLQARFVGYETTTRTVQVTAGSATQLRLRLSRSSVEMSGIQVTALSPDREPTGSLDAEQIRTAEVADPGALLRDLPGINSVRRGPVGLDPNVRGLSETEVGTYIGGMRTFPAGPARMDSPMSHVDPSTIKSIDVVKGPYALTWGPGNMSAIQVTQRGEDPPRTPLTGTVRAGYDTNREAREATVFGMGRQGDWFYSVNGAWRGGSTFDAGNGQPIPADYESAEGRARIGVELTDRSTLSLSGSYQDQEDIDYPGRLLNADFFETGMGQLTYEFAQNENMLRGLTVRASAQQTLHGMTNEGKCTFEKNGCPDGKPPAPFRIGVDSEIQNVSGRVAADLVLGAWDLTVGGDVVHTFRDATRPLEAVMPNGNRVVPPFYRRGDEILDNAWPGVTITQEGVFAEASRALGDLLTLTGTTRLDLAQSDANDPTQPFLENAGVSEAGLDQSDVMPSGAVTASLVLTERWTLSLGGGTVARPPSALERYADRFPASKSQMSAEFQGIPSLDPERSTQGDLWLEGDGQAWSLSVNAFARRVDDYITLAPTGIDPILPLSKPQTVFRYVNGEATFYGTEVDATVSLAEPLTARASGSYLWGEDETADEPAFGVSPASAALGLRWTHQPTTSAVGEVFVDGGVELVAEQDRAATTRRETETDGYTTVDLRAGATVLERVRLDVSVENLFDETYVNHLNAKNPFSGDSLPEPGRVVSTTLRLRF